MPTQKAKIPEKNTRIIMRGNSFVQFQRIFFIVLNIIVNTSKFIMNLNNISNNPNVKKTPNFFFSFITIPVLPVRQPLQIGIGNPRNAYAGPNGRPNDPKPEKPFQNRTSKFQGQNKPSYISKPQQAYQGQKDSYQYEKNTETPHDKAYNGNDYEKSPFEEPRNAETEININHVTAYTAMCKNCKINFFLNNKLHQHICSNVCKNPTMSISITAMPVCSITILPKASLSLINQMPPLKENRVLDSGNGITWKYKSALHKVGYCCLSA